MAGMKILGVIIILLPIEWTVGSQCESTAISRQDNKGTARNCSLECLDWNKLKLEGVRFLSLANCRISLIENISQNSNLEELDLMNNELRHLSLNLLQNFTNLKVLNVKGNPITSISLSIIQAVHVIFDCSCDVLRDLMHNCNKAVNCTQSFLDNLNCTNNSSVLNVSSFYPAECERLSLIPVYVLVPLLIAVIVGISVFVLMKQRSKLNSSDVSPNKHHSVSTSDHGQQRYTSTTNWKDAAAVTAGTERSREVKQQPEAHKDYENVLMGESDGAQRRCDRNQKTSDDTYYLESTPACDIYINEQPVYCNYTGSNADPEDDVYIMPDS
ncbi:uncharacterized protein LOC144689038 [Cetorhinus maximus]